MSISQAVYEAQIQRIADLQARLADLEAERELIVQRAENAERALAGADRLTNDAWARLAEAETKQEEWYEAEAQFYGLPYDGDRQSSVMKLSARLADADALLREAVDVVASCHDCIRIDSPELLARIDAYLSREQP